MESFERRLEKKLQTNEGQPPYPFFWGVISLKNLSVYQISHLYNYLVGKDDYSVENLGNVSGNVQIEELTNYAINDSEMGYLVFA